MKRVGRYTILLETAPKIAGAHSGQFMKFIENDSIFKNFMENFTRQFNDPSKTGLYRLVADKVESSVMILQEMLQQPQENEEQLKLMRVNLEDYAPKEQLGRVNEERIDWNELTAIGISREQLRQYVTNTALLHGAQVTAYVPDAKVIWPRKNLTVIEGSLQNRERVLEALLEADKDDCGILTGVR